MLMVLFVIVPLVWLAGRVNSYTVWGSLHILLLAALVVMLIRIAEGRRPF